MGFIPDTPATVFGKGSVGETGSEEGFIFGTRRFAKRGEFGHTERLDDEKAILCDNGDRLR